MSRDARGVSELVFEHVWSDPLKDVSLRASRGVSVILGAESDGTAALVELCAGVRAPRRGQVTVGAEAPSRSPSCRRRVASLLAIEPPLGSGDVRRWLEDLATLRPISPAAVLESCSVRGDRPLASLSGAERRELACWVALSQSEAALVVLHDPLSACGAGQRERALGRIAELGKTTTVLLTTASIAAARRLGGSRWRLDRGLLEGDARAGSAGHVEARAAWHGVGGAGLTIEADAPRALVAALAQHPDVQELRYDESGGRVLLRGTDVDRLASAVTEAIASSGVEIRSLRAGADDLDALRAATSAMNDAAGAAYRAAMARGRQASSATPELSPSGALPSGGALSPRRGEAAGSATRGEPAGAAAREGSDPTPSPGDHSP